MTTLTVQKQNESAATPSMPRTSPSRLIRTLMNWDPFQEMAPRFHSAEVTFMPDFEVSEGKDNYTFKADVPGIKEADLNVTVTGNQLVVTGKRTAEEKHQDQNFYLYERSYGSFSRTFTLPDTAECDKCNAELKDGVLTLVVPKKAETQPKKVAISASKA